jgi:predicted glycosyltransferase
MAIRSHCGIGKTSLNLFKGSEIIQVVNVNVRDNEILKRKNIQRSITFIAFKYERWTISMARPDRHADHLPTDNARRVFPRNSQYVRKERSGCCLAMSSSDSNTLSNCTQ